MQFQAVRTQEEFQQLSEEWNQLLTDGIASHVPFLRFEYLNTWWQTLGGGEWDGGELFIVAAREDHGALTGIAPLFFRKNREDQPALMLLGSIEISDYLDLIVDRERLPEFTSGLLSFIAEKQAPSWEVLDLYNIPEESPTLPALKNAAEQLGWSYRQEQLQPCPYIPLPGDWDAYLAGINKKQRHEIRRKIRRAENSEQQVRWYFVEDESALDAEIEDFLQLMAQDPEKDRFLTDVMRTQMHASVHAAFQAGWLQLSFLEIGGIKAAGYLNFDYDGHIMVYNSGLSYDFGNLSPGWVLLGYLLKWANENGRSNFDFMRGDEAYKYRFGGVNRYVTRAVIQRP